MRNSDETTCPRHLRKDLGRESAERAHGLHKEEFPLDAVQFVRTKERVPEDSSAIGQDTIVLETDRVGEAVVNYRMLDTTFASLVQLREIPGVRAELAMLSLGRSYIRHCVRKGGPWTSGLHLVWWTRKRLGIEPEIRVGDLRYQAATTMERQAEIAAWSMLMLRLNLISDVGALAPPEEPVSGLADLIEKAAEATETPDLHPLLEWLRREGVRLFDEVLPRERYKRLWGELHQQGNEATQD